MKSCKEKLIQQYQQAFNIPNSSKHLNLHVQGEYSFPEVNWASTFFQTLLQEVRKEKLMLLILLFHLTNHRLNTNVPWKLSLHCTQQVLLVKRHARYLP